MKLLGSLCTTGRDFFTSTLPVRRVPRTITQSVQSYSLWPLCKNFCALWFCIFKLYSDTPRTLSIINSLTFGTKRFREISKKVPGIIHKVLSKELKELEMNKLIIRTVYDSFPLTVEYAITGRGRSLQKSDRNPA